MEKKNKVTKEEFEKNWIKKSNISLENFNRMNLIAVPCDCNINGCKGWQMVNKR